MSQLAIAVFGLSALWLAMGNWQLTPGYPSRDDASRRLVLPWRGMRNARITHPHFGLEPVEVYAISVDARHGDLPPCSALCNQGGSR